MQNYDKVIPMKPISFFGMPMAHSFSNQQPWEEIRYSISHCSGDCDTDTLLYVVYVCVYAYANC